ncbi:hypothetical protein GY45DRAFT_1328958 [Cubamyces sp. BRFM 1775]|nr:hypothetical protein GY45DRAFT_1328958 [Cubamyces sp. BRFM 1775]
MLLRIAVLKCCVGGPTIGRVGRTHAGLDVRTFLDDHPFLNPDPEPEQTELCGRPTARRKDGQRSGSAGHGA